MTIILARGDLARINTSTPWKTLMHTTPEIGLDAQREILRQSLNEIANDIGMVMRDAGLHFPVFLTVRDSGDSLATIATPLDPSDDDWSRAAAIVCEIKRTASDRLRNRELLCAVANSAPMSAAEVGPG